MTTKNTFKQVGEKKKIFKNCKKKPDNSPFYFSVCRYDNECSARVSGWNVKLSKNHSVPKDIYSSWAYCGISAHANVAKRVVDYLFTIFYIDCSHLTFKVT